jgi:hypothetical protein
MWFRAVRLRTHFARLDMYPASDLQTSSGSDFYLLFTALLMILQLPVAQLHKSIITTTSLLYFGVRQTWLLWRERRKFEHGLERYVDIISQQRTHLPLLPFLDDASRHCLTMLSKFRFPHLLGEKTSCKQCLLVGCNNCNISGVADE